MHKVLKWGVVPRPIALVSTISEEGIENLAPFR
jgi:flavin reductase (DIM6/NTAB) family NADH-FMN oxidoreductase RutF